MGFGTGPGASSSGRNSAGKYSLGTAGSVLHLATQVNTQALAHRLERTIGLLSGVGESGYGRCPGEGPEEEIGQLATLVADARAVA